MYAYTVNLVKVTNYHFSIYLLVIIRPYELVAAYLWGLALVNPGYGFRYYLSFVDAYSKFTWIFF